MSTVPVSLEAKSRGEVFTRQWVVDLMLGLVEYTPDLDLSTVRVVEPAVGSGAFWGPILDRLLGSFVGRNDWGALAGALRGYDIHEQNIATCRDLTIAKLSAAGCPAATAEMLVRGWLRTSDFLLTEHDQPADLVIGNPPYIRIEQLEAELLAAYRKAVPAMGGRADVFVGFYEHGLDLLAPGGRLAFICADRWMRNAYGKKLRAKVVDGFAVDDVIVMHDADAFESEVSAYPAITVLSRRPQAIARTATAERTFGAGAARDYLTWRTGGTARVRTADVAAAAMPSWHETDDIWPDGSPELQAWLERLAETLPLLECAADGTRLGIGVATGADRVYVRRPPRLPDVESDRLLPMVTAADIKSGRFEWTGHHLINPWTPEGPVDLDDYPKLGAYYQAAGTQITGRNIVKRSGPYWYRTIDRVNYPLLTRELLVMEDMKAEAHPVRVPRGFYPHHNLYWITSDAWELDALGGLLLSKVVEKQVGAYCVKMRGGTLRFQATVLRKVRAPRPADIAPGVLEALADAFRARDRYAATVAAMHAFGLDCLPQ